MILVIMWKRSTKHLHLKELNATHFVIQRKKQKLSKAILGIMYLKNK